MENIEILITSSLDGRDLTIIKSILNIKNHYGNLIFKYSDKQKNSDVFITKIYEGSIDKYYVLLKKDKTTVSIEPNLNQRTLRALFEYLSQLDTFAVTGGSKDH